jgi:hypothetical protein
VDIFAVYIKEKQFDKTNLGKELAFEFLWFSVIMSQ